MQEYDRTSLIIWRWQRITAVLLLPLVLFHVIYLYYVIGMDGITVASVADRIKAAGFLILDVALLGVVVVHAFAGIRSVLIDYAGDKRKIRHITYAISILGSLTIGYALVALAAFI